MQPFDWLRRRAELTPQRTALIDQATGEQISYHLWEERAERLAHLFHHAAGIRKGDCVAILAMNSPAYLDAFFACGKRGAILQNLNWRLPLRDLQKLLQETNPKLLIYSNEFLSTVQSLQASLPSIPHWLGLDQLARAEDMPLALRESYDLQERLPPVEIVPHDPWLLCYTGGTTGTPKGAILTHQTILANAIQTAVTWGLDAEDTAILNAPLFHVGGMNVFTTPLVYLGGCSIVCKQFEPEMVFALIEKQGVTVFFGVPTMFLAMQEHPRWASADLSRTKFVISGGAPCPSAVFEKFWQKGVHFKTGYGLTEAGPNNFWLPKEDIQRKPGSVGFPLLHIEMKIVLPDGREAQAEEVGELCLRGAHVMTGYWKRPEDTAEALHDGWLWTGDLARRDAEGYYYIVGRRKDMYISGGENIYPAEIESALHEMHGIAEAAVIGVPHERWGEVGLALIRLEEQASLTPRDVLRYCEATLARYKIPHYIVLSEAIPKTSAGKIDKQAIAKQFQDALPLPIRASSAPSR